MTRVSLLDPMEPRDSEYRIAKARTEVTLSLSNGTSVRGCLFLAGASATHDGPERIKDVLNAEPGFFPFEVRNAGGARTVLYNPEHVVMVMLPNNDEPRSEPGYDVATRRTFEVILSSGLRMTGSVRVYLPPGHDRLSDHARQGDSFSYLESDGATYIINCRHVLELMEIVEP